MVHQKTKRNSKQAATMSLTKRRMACPQTVHQIWDSIAYNKQQKQVPTMDRIANYMKRLHGLGPSDVERQVGFAVRDQLVRLVKRMGCKGSKVGVEQESYLAPNDDVELDNHDWYCFECHRGGEVICCSTCHRVYHPFCIKDPSQDAKLICAVCTMLKTKSTMKMKKNDLNTLLGFACNRLKEKKTKDLMKLPLPKDEPWRHSYLVFHPMDLVTMENKTQDKKYTRLEEFQVDAQSLVHNVVIYYGVHSQMADMARLMLRDCIYDLGEIRQCRDCYRMSNEKTDKFWFCQPCNPAHELVYAKQKGFPFWPAKVIRNNNDIYDVRFFGGYHQRANIEKENIRPITATISSMAIKRSASWNKAWEELKKHQEFLETKGETKVPKHCSEDEESDHEPEVKLQSQTPKYNNTNTNTNKRSRHNSGERISDGHLALDQNYNVQHEEEASISSTSKSRKKMKQIATSEDYNVVSSSSQETVSTKVSVSTQTLTEKKSNTRSRGSQTVTEVVESVVEPVPVPIKRGRQPKSEDSKKTEEKLRRQFEEEKEKSIANTTAHMTKELERTRKQIEEQCQERYQQELKIINERNRQTISETKKKQWCYHCEAEAMYHCCWNTSYCSTDCQQIHWQNEHKRTCRRKR